MAARPMTQDGCMGGQRDLWLSHGVMDGGAVAVNDRAVVAVQAPVVIGLAYFASEAKVGNATDTHFVHEDVFKLDVSVDISGDFVQVSYTSDDLAEHHAGVIQRQGGRAIPFKDIEERASGAEECDVKVSMGCMLGGKEREDVFVAERGPDIGFVVETFSDQGWIILSSNV